MHTCAQRALGIIVVAGAAFSFQAIDADTGRPGSPGPGAPDLDVADLRVVEPAPPGWGGIDPTKRKVEVPAPAEPLVATLEGATMAIDPASGDRIFLCGFDDGHLMTNTFDPWDGYSGWTDVPETMDTSNLGSLAGCDLVCLEGGARIILRAFADGAVQQNVYLPGSGYTGWLEVPDPLEIKPEAAIVSVSLHLFGLSMYAPRVVIRGLDDGTIQQNFFDPVTGYTGWADLPEVP